MGGWVDLTRNIYIHINERFVNYYRKLLIMQDYLYFSYGSNMSSMRLKKRVESAEVISSGILENHKLVFHKKSTKDGSGKCDAFLTNSPNDKVYGVIYSIHKNDLKRLDSFEDLNGGYKKEDVDIAIANGEKVKAFTYIATNIEKSLLPFSWYKYHVLHGAVENNLPPDYISFIDSFNSVTDPDKENAADELSIYLKNFNN